MPQLLVPDLDDALLDRLKERARRSGRSLQAEAAAILEAAVPPRYTRAEALAVFRRWQRHFAGRTLSDSAELIREDRGR
jgi:antitoxin FitA